MKQHQQILYTIMPIKITNVQTNKHSYDSSMHIAQSGIVASKKI